jgi:hypothetical protein
MSRETHVRFCEGAGVQFPRATRQGVVRKRVRRLPRAEWAVFIPDHHEGFIDWSTYEANQARIGASGLSL